MIIVGGEQVLVQFTSTAKILLQKKNHASQRRYKCPASAYFLSNNIKTKNASNYVIKYL
jgi:hypothetical protein